MAAAQKPVDIADFEKPIVNRAHTGIEVKVQSVKGSLDNDQDVLVNISYKNHTAANVDILKWYLPDAEGNIEDDIFKITRDGIAVDYTGRHYKRPAPTAADYVTLAPSEELNFKVELSGVYDFSEQGYYRVGMSVDNKALFAPVTADNSKRAMPSALNAEFATDVFVTKVRAKKGKPCNPRKEDCSGGTDPGGDGVSFTGNCSNSEQSSLLSALDAAKTITNDSVSYLNGNSGPRYNQWFGADSSQRWNTVASNFDAIKDGFDNKPLTLDCSCNQSYFAYVYPNQPYKIYLCRAFWNARETGTDSRAGTLVHEMSHFNAVAGTDDIVYGQSGAASLADSNPNDAVKNADSHEYFAENTPNLN